MLTDLGLIITGTLTEVWLGVVAVLPRLLGAVIIFIVGLFVAEGCGRFMAKLANRAYLDKAVVTTGLKTILERVGFKIEVSKALGLLVTWFLYAVALIAAADILGLSQISEFLRSVVMYIPNVIIAVVILVVGIAVSNFIQTLVKETSVAAQLASADILATGAKWAILIFTFMAALIQLGVATSLIQILFTGLVLMIALAGGIAFGLGGKDRAKEVIDRLIK